jgi:hypothetical protein
MLLAAASGYEAKKQPDKVIELATKAIEVTNAKAKPAGVADADWANYKAQLVSRSNFMIGMQHAAANRWPQAEQALKLALPGIKADATMSSAALFHLGLANYKMAEAGNMDRIRDAVDFFEQCAAVAGPYQAPARQNIKAIRSRYRVQK